jgi:hypothetical protein
MSKEETPGHIARLLGVFFQVTWPQMEFGCKKSENKQPIQNNIRFSMIGYFLFYGPGQMAALVSRRKIRIRKPNKAHPATA